MKDNSLQGFAAQTSWSLNSPTLGCSFQSAALILPSVTREQNACSVLRSEVKPSETSRVLFSQKEENQKGRAGFPGADPAATRPQAQRALICPYPPTHPEPKPPFTSLTTQRSGLRKSLCSPLITFCSLHKSRLKEVFWFL